MKITKHVAEPVVVPPPTFTLEVSEVEAALIRLALNRLQHDKQVDSWCEWVALEGVARKQLPTVISHLTSNLFTNGLDHPTIKRIISEGQD